MNQEKVLGLTLEINKSLTTYWNKIQDIFSTDIKFLIPELELCDAIVYKLIGYQSSENNICSDPILNTMDDYFRDNKTLQEAKMDLFAIENFLKENNLYVEFNVRSIIENLINLYLSLEESEKSLMKLLGTDDTSIINDLEKVENIIRTIFKFDCEFLKRHSLISFIDNLLMFNDVDEIITILNKTNDILN